MSQVLDADQPTIGTPTGPRSVLAGVIVGTFWVVSVLALGVGLWLAAAAVESSVTGDMPVRIGPEAPDTDFGGFWPCVDGTTGGGGPDGCEPSASSDQWPVDVGLPMWSDGAPVTVGQLDPWWARLAATAGLWGVWLAAGALGLLYLPSLRQIATGRGQVRTDLRLAITAGVVFLTWVAATVGPYLAAGEAIHSMETTALLSMPPDGTAYMLPKGWLLPDLRVSWWPGVVVLLLVALALASRNGRRLAAQSEGLV